MKNRAIWQMMDMQHSDMSVMRVDFIEQVNGEYIFEVDMLNEGVEDGHTDEIHQYEVRVNVTKLGES